ncbi:unnamed protein product, partial [Ilex paraguariensis]
MALGMEDGDCDFLAMELGDSEKDSDSSNCCLYRLWTVLGGPSIFCFTVFGLPTFSAFGHSIVSDLCGPVGGVGKGKNVEEEVLKNGIVEVESWLLLSNLVLRMLG